MVLVIRREQKVSSGLLSGKRPVFLLSFRAELTDDEKAAIAKYQFGSEIIYRSNPVVETGVLGNLVNNLSIEIRIAELVAGRTVASTSVVSMLELEERLKDVGRAFQTVLDAARRFGGDEIVDLTK